MKKVLIFSLVAVFLFLVTEFTNSGIVQAKKTIGDAGSMLGETLVPAGVEERDVGTMVAQIIQGALLLTGTVFLILMVYAGFIWMTARGNEEQVTKAKNTIIAAIIGITLVVGAYAISNFVMSRLF